MASGSRGAILSLSYKGMIFEAISTLKQPNGSGCGSIAAFIRKREQNVPQNFRKLLNGRLRRLVQQNKLEKVFNHYKIKSGAPAYTKSAPKDAKGPDVKQKGPELKPVESISYHEDRIAKFAAYAAHRVAEAENKALEAAVAVRVAEKVTGMAEGAKAILQFAMECVKKAEREEPFIFKLKGGLEHSVKAVSPSF